MTGAVSWEVLSWVVGIAVAVAIGVSGFLLWVWGVVKGLREEFDAELTARDAAIKDASLKAEAINARATLMEGELRKEIADYKQHAGETFATKEGVSVAVQRVEQAVDRLTGRIDRLLERRPGET